MQLSAQLVQGVDVWINTPRRPWEACGTSGMKVLVNGGLNLSELDGWWAEAYSAECGWALGDGALHDGDPTWDMREADTLYDLLEREVVPAFYQREAQGIPTAWVGRMRASMASLTPRFSSNRAVCEYAERYYLPAATAYLQRAAERGRLMVDALAGRQELMQKWDRLRFGELTRVTQDGQHRFEVAVWLNGIDPQALRVELYADGAQGAAPVREPMWRERDLPAAVGSVYVGSVPATRPASDYTPRLMPFAEGIAVPLEECLIKWQR